MLDGGCMGFWNTVGKVTLATGKLAGELAVHVAKEMLNTSESYSRLKDKSDEDLQKIINKEKSWLNTPDGYEPYSYGSDTERQIASKKARNEERSRKQKADARAADLILRSRKSKD